MKVQTKFVFILVLSILALAGCESSVENKNASTEQLQKSSDKTYVELVNKADLIVVGKVLSVKGKTNKTFSSSTSTQNSVDVAIPYIIYDIGIVESLKNSEGNKNINLALMDPSIIISSMNIAKVDIEKEYLFLLKYDNDKKDYLVVDYEHGVYSFDNELMNLTSLTDKSTLEYDLLKSAINNINSKPNVQIGSFSNLKVTDVKWLAKEGGLPSVKKWPILIPEKDSEKITKIINLVNSSSSVRKSTEEDLKFLHLKHGYPVDIVIKINDDSEFLLKSAMTYTVKQVANGTEYKFTTYKDRFILVHDKNGVIEYYTVFSSDVAEYIINTSNLDFPR